MGVGVREGSSRREETLRWRNGENWRLVEVSDRELKTRRRMERNGLYRTGSDPRGGVGRETRVGKTTVRGRKEAEPDQSNSE